MGREIRRLSALKVARENRPGLYPDGAGLYLQVTRAGSRSWVYRYTLNGKTRYMGLGSVLALSLAQARKKAGEARHLRQEGIDPIDARKADRARARLEAAKTISFKAAAEQYIEAQAPGWSHPRQAAQWRASLEAYAYPVFGTLPVSAVDVTLIHKALQPIWNKKTETARRVRGRIESILDWATVRRYRIGDNPARWRGNLKSLLAEPSKLQQVRHFPALLYDEIGAFVAELRRQDGTAARALEFLILTAARTSEVIGARDSEFDMRAAAWTVPAERIKSRREHRVPLSRPAVAIVETVREDREASDGDGFVFPGGKKGKPLSNMAMLALLGRMGRSNLTVHGFRSSFRDWAAERTNYPREVAEAALAHTIGAVEAAYRRGDLFDKRRALMAEWARYCGTARDKKAANNVTPIRGRTKKRASGGRGGKK